MNSGSVGRPSFSGTNVLVTGASGFIGTHLCHSLIREGAQVHGVSRQEHFKNENGLRWWCADLSDAGAVHQLLNAIKPELIFHLAGYPVGARDLIHVIPSFRCNLLSTVNLLAAAAEVGCRRFVLAGSLEEPEEGGLTIVPSSPYAVAKWAGSAYARMFHKLYEFPVVILRIFMVYGPGQQDRKKLIPYVILSLLRGEAPKVTSGQREVDWIYVADVVEGFLAAARFEGIEGAMVDIGSGRLVSVRRVVEHLVWLIDQSIEPHFGALTDRPLEQVRMANTMRTSKMIDWEPSIPLEKGLELTVDWFRSHPK